MQNRDSVLRAAVVGAGLMGGWHAACIQHAGASLKAVVDTDEKRASILAARYKGARAYTRLEDALSQSRPDIVHVCTPTSTHLLLAEQALEAGAHLFVEKPLVSTAEDTQSILTLAEQKGLSVCPVHQFVFQEGMRRIQTWLPAAGDILQISLTIHSAGGAGVPVSELDGLVADILPHPLSLLQALLPGSVESRLVVHRPAPGELRVTGTGCSQKGNGIGLAIEISMNARPTQNSLSIAARRATFYADLFHGFAYRLPGNVSRTHKIVQPFETSMRHLGAATGNLTRRVLNGESAYPGLRRLVTLFYQSLRTGEPLPISHQDTLAVAKARQAILSG